MTNSQKLCSIYMAAFDTSLTLRPIIYLNILAIELMEKASERIGQKGTVYSWSRAILLKSL